MQEQSDGSPFPFCENFFPPLGEKGFLGFDSIPAGQFALFNVISNMPTAVDSINHTNKSDDNA